MEPQQQPGQLGHNPYDFILNPPKPTDEHPLGGLPLPRVGKHSLILQIAVLLGGAILLMIIIAIVVSVLTGKKLDSTKLISLAAEQTELVSISTTGGSVVTQASNQQLAINTQLTLETDNQALLSFLASDGIKVTSKQLEADANAEVAIELQNARQNSTVDQTFAQIMQNQLQTYANNIQSDYNKATNTSLRQLLKIDYAQAKLLLKQVPSASSVQG